MRTEIFNGNSSINRLKLITGYTGKKHGFRPVLLSLVIISSIMGCSDGAINAYMDYYPNRAPQILELQSDFSGMPVPGDIIKIYCETYDPDGNPLTYNYTSSRGSFTDQADGGGKSEITFIVGNITGGEDVNVSVLVTDSKKASAAATLNIGTSSMGPVITLVKPVSRTMGADGYSTVTFRSNMEGYYQVSLAGDGTAADKMDPERSLFIIKRNTDTLFTLCGPLYSGGRHMEGIPRLKISAGNRVQIKVMDKMNQISLYEIEFEVKGTAPYIENREIRVTDLKKGSLTLNWDFAVDRDNSEEELEYRVYRSEECDISRLEDAEFHGNIVMDWKPDLNFYTVAGLKPATGYYFNIVVRDNDKIKEIYNSVYVTTLEGTISSYYLRYNYNYATGGSLPDDEKPYNEGQKVMVQGNRGNLMRNGYIFSDWNTAADGSGTGYAGGDFLIMESADIVLYAMWITGFVTRWRTDNPGISEDNQVTIPVYEGETYDYSVDWGGRHDQYSSYRQRHPYLRLTRNIYRDHNWKIPKDIL